jgi:hypothetical protein
LRRTPRAGGSLRRGPRTSCRRALARLGAEGPEAIASEENRFARLQLIDALLRLDVRAPGAEAALGRDTDLEWRVCGNLLAGWRAPGFAAQCLQELGV